MLSQTLKTTILATVIALLFAASIPLTERLVASKPPEPRGYADEDLSLKGADMRGWVFGAEGLIADWYWMNSLQYIGGKISTVGLDKINIDDLSALNPRLLHQYLNNTVDLDPRFIAAYSYGATVLPAIDVDQAIALTEKGIANNPDNWRLYQYLGYIHWRRKDYDKASEVYSAGSKIAGAPSFLREMAAAMKTRGGSRETARQLYLQMFEEAGDQQSKRNAELRLFEIDALDELDVLNELLTSVKESSKRCPAKLIELFPRLARTELPRGRSFSIDRENRLVDPSGVPYRFDAEKCRADLSFDSTVPRTLE